MYECVTKASVGGGSSGSSGLLTPRRCGLSTATGLALLLSNWIWTLLLVVSRLGSHEVRTESRVVWLLLLRSRRGLGESFTAR